MLKSALSWQVKECWSEISIDSLLWFIIVERLRIKTLPTLALVKDAKTKDYVVGFTDLGNTDEFTTEMLEWRIAHADVIDYSGDLLVPPGQATKSKLKIKSKKTIRENDDEESDWATISST